MKVIKYFLCLFALLITTFSVQAAESKPGKDGLLVEKLKLQQVRLIVLRHGESTNTLANKVVSSNSPGIFLSERGIQQTTSLASQLIGENVEKIYCSPLFRVRQAASIFRKILDLPYPAVVIDNRLVLQSFGNFEGMPYQIYTSYFSKFQNIYIRGVPGGESGVDVFKRIHSFLWDVANQNVDSTVVVITHGFNCAQINMCLTGEYGRLLTSGNFNLYDFH